MRLRALPLLLASALLVGLVPAAAGAASFSFTTGSPDGLMGMASRPATGGQVETEAADDVVLDATTTLTQASFTGLLPSGTLPSAVQSVGVEVYRVFPQDSANPPSGSVPTRVNSPADVAFDTRTGSNGLAFTVSTLNASFSVANSVDIGINKLPNQRTGGEGSVTGEEVQIGVTFDPPLRLPAGHWFVVPQVGVGTSHFLWLSAPKPIVAGTPFTPDLQAWIRNAGLDPDWLRVGTDVVGGGTPPTFNAAFTLAGSACSAIAVASATLGGTAGTPLSSTFGAAGGVAPYTFTETGALPSGIALSPAGVLSGTPTAAGSFPIVVTATDATGCTGATSLTVTVGPASGPTGGGTGAGSGQPAPTPTPTITALRIAPASFAAAARGASLAARPRRAATPVGTTISYRDSLAATTTFTILRAVRGVVQGRACRLGGHPRHGRSCIRYVTLGHLTHVDVTGRNRVRFSGRLHGRKLPLGLYLLRVRPRVGRRAGTAVSVRFRVLRASR